MGDLSFQNFLNAHKRYPIIGVTGMPGSGKSTIARDISENIGDTVLLSETPESNEFLDIIKRTQGRINQGLWYQNQMTFLSQDMGISVSGIQESQKRSVVFDFSIAQTQVYAILKLQGYELKNFMDFYKNSLRTIGGVDILINVSANEETLIERYKNRNTFIDSQLIDEAMEMSEIWKSRDITENAGKKIITIDNSGELEDTLDLVYQTIEG